MTRIKQPDQVPDGDVYPCADCGQVRDHCILRIVLTPRLRLCDACFQARREKERP
jgi:hypothetical protein